MNNLKFDPWNELEKIRLENRANTANDDPSPIRTVRINSEGQNSTLSIRELPIKDSEAILRGDYSSICDTFAPSLKELADVSGDEWSIIASNMRDLKNLNEMIIINKMIAARVRPPWHTHKATCQNCGEVWLDFKVEETVLACPWCHSVK